MKKVYLIGSNVEGVSKSKPMHDAFGLYDYELKNVSTAELESFIKTTPFDGLNVTIPHKKAIMALLDEISPEARAIGAVNVVVKKDGRLLGYNTDIYGIEYAFSCHNATLKDKGCLILGTGGTSNTAAYFCKKHGAKYIAKASRAPKLGNDVNEISYSQAYEKDFDVIINTTPVGMTPNTDETPIEITRFTAVTALFDAIYTPEETKLIKEAKAQNINAFGGIEMLAAQGKYAAELFTDTQLSNTLITTALKAIKD